MKKQLLIIATLVITLGVSSCKKDDNTSPQTPAPTPTPTTTNQLFMSFSLDGVAKSITATSNNVNTGFGGGSFTSATFFDFINNASINLSMPNDTILGSDLQALVGQKILIGSCGGCPTNIHLEYDINGNTYKSYDSHNPFPTNYIKFTSVTFYKNVNLFGKSLNQYYVTGEFDLNLSYGSTIKHASNGTFKMIFQEAKN